MKNSGALFNARLLRKRMTEPEKILWQELRTKKLGVKFRRQMPLVFEDCHFVVDFYCASKKLIIEVDGGIHNLLEIKEYDEFREGVLKRAGYKIIRFENQEVEDDLDQVLIKIKTVLSKKSFSLDK